MTRKLAATVFAMSLTLVGCGSSSTTKVDGGKDAQPTSAPDAGAPDAAKPIDVANMLPDAGAADVVAVPDSGAPTDAVSLVTDGGTDAASVSPDTSTTKVDGGKDAQPTSAPDAGAPDAVKPIDVANMLPDAGGAGQPDTASSPDASKLDALTMTPPDGANLNPACPPGNYSGFRTEFCYGNGLFWSALACPAGGSCNCVSVLRAYCANRCVELPDESAECQ